MAKLVVLLSDGSTRDVPLRKERITLGRRPDNDVCLPHPAVSGEHAAVVTILSDSFLEDLGSTNGTSVNGQPIQKHILHDGDVIELGRQRLVFLQDEHAQLASSGGVDAGAMHRTGTSLSASTDVGTWDKPSTEPGASSSSTHDAHESHAATVEGPVTDAPPPPVAIVRTAVHHAVETPLPELLVLTGPNAGRTLALTKEVTSIGRVGVQVALVRRTREGFVLVAGDGSAPPVLNGSAVPREGMPLEPGDIIDVAGARIEFLAATDLPL